MWGYQVLYSCFCFLTITEYHGCNWLIRINAGRFPIQGSSNSSWLNTYEGQAP